MSTVKTLLKSVREYKKVSLITPVFMILEAMCECLIPFIMSKMLIGTAPLPQILTYGGAMIVLAVLSLTCGILGGNFAAKASCGFAKNLRHDLFYAVQKFSFKDVDKFSASSLVTRLTTDVTNVQQAYQMCLRIVIRVPIMFIFSVIMSMSINWKLALVFVIIVPFLLGALILLMSKIMPFFRKIFKKYDALNNSVQENVGGIRVVKSFVREEHEKQKFEKSAREVRDDFTKAEKMIAFTSPIMMFAMFTSSMFITFIGATLIIKTGAWDAVAGAVVGPLTPSQLSAVITYGVQMLSSMMMVSMIAVMLTMSIESANRISEVINEQSEIVTPDQPITEVKDGSVRFENVSFKYSAKAEKYALSDIDLEIRSGETVGILGGTGSSKTTLIQLSPRLYDATEGTVYVGGVDVKNTI